MNRAELEATALSGAEKAIRLMAKNTLVEGVVVNESGKLEKVASLEWLEQKTHHLHLSEHDIMLRFEGRVEIYYDNGVGGFKDKFSVDLTARVVINHKNQCRVTVKGNMKDVIHSGYGYEVDYTRAPTKM